jgi:uroporphyrinogen decarboxylase
VIVFVRGGGANLRQVVDAGFADCIALDWTLDPATAVTGIPAHLATQGNLDPLALVASGAPLDLGIDVILQAVRDRPHIFNLGHGIVPETPIAHVERMIARVRNA